MPQSNPQSAEVWREACRHTELNEAAASIFRLLAKHLSLSRLLVRRLSAEPASLATVAGYAAGLGSASADQRQHLEGAELRRLAQWCGGESSLRRPKRSTGLAKLLVPDDLEGDCVVLPLHGRFGSKGVLLVAAAAGHEFDRGELAVIESLREPFSIALDNDWHEHEIARLRKAAESDRGSLLQKLGRTELADTVVGEQSGLRLVMERVGLVARSDVPVLILGETGTGKELIARALHARGARPEGPFIRVNCGAIPRELIDSQLFGHEKGSFTGAEQSRQGWFERADGGTLFLDEVGELPLDAQVRFLRVLQDGFVERVGGVQPIHVDVRVVAATHRELATMVREGGFREDLWYRLAVFPILLPPLRERVDDIPAMIQHFVDRAAVRFGLPATPPTAEGVAKLQAYDWPGNIRELGAVIDRAVILGNGRSLDIDTALGYAGSTAGRREPRGGPPPTASPAGLPSKAARDGQAAPQAPLSQAPLSQAPLSLDQAMREHIESVLRLTGGKVEGRRGAAELLRINPHTLRARMRKLGIDWSQYRELPL